MWISIPRGASRWLQLSKSQISTLWKGNSTHCMIWHKDSGNTLYKREAVIVKIWAVLCRHLMSEMLGWVANSLSPQEAGLSPLMQGTGTFLHGMLTPLNDGSACPKLSAFSMMPLCKAVESSCWYGPEAPEMGADSTFWFPSDCISSHPPEKSLIMMKPS